MVNYYARMDLSEIKVPPSRINMDQSIIKFGLSHSYSNSCSYFSSGTNQKCHKKDDFKHIVFYLIMMQKGLLFCFNQNYDVTL